MVNVGKYTIHGASGLYYCLMFFLKPEPLEPAKMGGSARVSGISFPHCYTELKSNTSPLKKGGWKMIRLPFGVVTFQGRAVQIRGCSIFVMEMEMFFVVWRWITSRLVFSIEMDWWWKSGSGTRLVNYQFFYKPGKLSTMNPPRFVVKETFLIPLHIPYVPSPRWGKFGVFYLIVLFIISWPKFSGLQLTWIRFFW